MRVLIVENELYLAQSISNKLGAMNYHCDIVSSVSQAPNAHYDVLLLSTNIANFAQLVSLYSKSIVILMVSYISVDTVVEPLRLGACDYVQKPFMVEELVRKIKHYQDFAALQRLNESFLSYIHYKLATAKSYNFAFKRLHTPLILRTYKQINADSFVLSYAKAHDIGFECVVGSEMTSAKNVLKMAEKSLVFVSDFHKLALDEREFLLKNLEKKNVILHTITSFEGFEDIDLNTDEKDLQSGEILTIEEYQRFVITHFEGIFADKDLAQKLGISRKSLWEKRKKYELNKKK